MRDPELDARLEENLATLSALVLVLFVAPFYLWTVNFPSQYADVANLLSNPGAAAFQQLFAAETWSARFEVLPEVLHRHMARPLLGLSYLLGSAYTQPPVGGHRLLNIALHLLATLLAFFAVRGALRDHRGAGAKSERGDLPVSALLAAAFALHPLQIESVVYVSGRDSLLATPPLLGAFLAFAASLRAARAGGTSTARLVPYIGGIALFVLALFCGQGALTLPLWILLYDWAVADKAGATTPRERAAFHGPLLVLTAGYAALYRIAASATGDPAMSHDYSVLATAPAQWLGYLRLLLAPVGLTVDHGFPKFASLGEPAALAALAGNALLLGGALVLAKRGARAIAAAIFAVYAALLPWAGLLPYRDTLVEHRASLAVPAFVSLLALVGAKLLAKRIGGTPQRHAASALAVLVLGATGVARAQVWQTHESLWRDAVAKNPGLARPHYQLGTVFLLADQKREAMSEFGEALRLDPNYAPAALNRGGLFLESGDLENARRNFERAAEADPDHPPSRYNLAEVLLRMGRLDEALVQIRLAIRLAPENGNFLEKEGEILREQGKFEDALASWNLALQKADLADPARLLQRSALLAFEHGYEATASGNLRMLTVLEPDKSESWYNFAYLKERIGEPEEAIKNYQRAIMLNPAMASAHFNLARIYEEQNKCKEAESHYRIAGSYEKRFLVEYDNFTRARQEGARCPMDTRPYFLPEPQK